MRLMPCTSKLHSSTLGQGSRVWDQGSINLFIDPWWDKGDCGPFESPGRLVPVERWSVSQKKKTQASLVSHAWQIWQLSITTACKHGVIPLSHLSFIHFDWKKFTVLRLYAIHNRGFSQWVNRSNSVKPVKHTGGRRTSRPPQSWEIRAHTNQWGTS